MATKDRVLIELYVDDQGTVKIQNAKAAVQELGTAGEQSFARSAAAGENFAASLVKQLGIYALLVTAAYKLEQAVVGAFKAGIQTVDDYQVAVIGIAASLTDMAKADQGSMEMVFLRNKAAAEDMYKAITVEAAKHFSSASEGMLVYNRLVQSGYAAQRSEVSALLLLTDKIKLATKGQNVEMQLNTEIIALMAGQAKAQSMIAMELQSRLGAGWGDLVKKHREAGDLLTWITTLFPGLVAANKEIENTINAQWATTKSLLDLLAIGGLSGAYQDIVNLIKKGNDYLRDNPDLVTGVARAWEGVKDIVQGIVGFIRESVDVTYSLGGAISYVLGLSKQGPWYRMASWLAQGPDVAGGFGAGAGMEMSPEQKGYWNQVAADRVAAYKAETFRMYAKDLGPTKTLTRTAKDKTGGGSGRDTTDSLESLIMQLRQEQAKLSEGAFAGVEAAYAKTVAKITKLAMDQKQLDEGLLAAKEWKAAKEQKIIDDHNKWYLGQMHQTTALQLSEDNKKLASVKGHAAQEKNIREVMALHAQERAEKLALAENQQQKTYYDSLASSSILIKDQVAWKEQSWLLEKKISQAQQEQWFIGKDLTESQKDNYRQLLALTNEAKEYNLARQKAVDLGTLEGWAIERAGEALKRDRASIKDMLTGAEGFFKDSLAQGIDWAFGSRQQSFKEVGVTIVKSMVLEFGKKSFTKIWDDVAKLIAGAPKDTTSGGLSSISAAERKAGKIGYSLGGDHSYADQIKQLKVYDRFLDKMYKDESKDLGGIQKLKDKMFRDDLKNTTAYSQMQDEMISKNQELFKANYLTQYQESFAGMVGGITEVWQVGQGIMTAAGISGEAARYGTMVTYGMQALSLLWTLITKGVLMKAFMAGAAAFSSVWETVGFPVALVLAPVMAAVAFAGTMAGGLMGGGGGSTLASSPGMTSTGAGYTEGYHSGGLVAHQGLLVAHNGLLPDERLVKVLTGEPILQRSAMAAYTSMGISFDDLNNARLPVRPVPVPGNFTTPARQSGGSGSRPAMQHHTYNFTIVTPDGKILGKHQINQVIGEVQNRFDSREIRIPASAVRKN